MPSKTVAATKFLMLGVVSSIPTDPPGTGAADASVRVEMGNAVLVQWANAGAVAGSAVLLVWLDELGKWSPYRQDAPITTTAGGRNIDRYEIPVNEAFDFLLWVQTTPAADLAQTFIRGAHFRGR